MEYERIPFPDAIENLAKQAGLTVPREESSDPKQRERDAAKEKARNTLYTLMEAADQFYQQQLRDHANKQPAVDYLKRRGLSGQIAKTFGIGYSPPGWDNLCSTLGTSNEKQDRLLEAGMLIHNEEKERLYDRFRERIMFPIRDTRGRVIGFGGRVLPGADDVQGSTSGAGGRKPKAAQPKYLNSPETPIFSKGKELYGLYEARQAYKQLPRLLVVEGYMDVVALAQYGIAYGVATLGTACGEDHLNRAFRFTNEIVFCFDGDEAGRKAARRAMENSIPAMEDGRQVKFLYLPEGEDPDTLVRQIGADKFTRLVEGATPLESFVFEELGQHIDTQTMEGRARLCKVAAPLLDQLPRGVYRELMFQQLANRTQLSIDALMTLLNELPAANEPTRQASTTEAINKTSNTYSRKSNSYDSGSYDSGSYDNAPENDTHIDHNTQREVNTYHHQEDSNIKPEYYLEQAPERQNTRLSSDRKEAKRSSQTSNHGERALSLLLFQPSLAKSITDLEALRHSQHENVLLLVELIELLHQRPEYTSGQILGHWQGTHGAEKGQELQELLTKGLLFQHVSELNQDQKEHSFNSEKEFEDAIQQLKKQQQDIDCHSIIQQLNSKPIDTWTEPEKQLYSNAIAAKANLN